MTEVISIDVAEVEFARFIEEFDIEIDTKNMSEEDEKSFQGQKSKIIKNIMSGNAVVDSDGNIEYTLKRPKDGGSLTKLNFTVPDGDVYTVMDKHKKDKFVGKANSALGVMTNNAPQVFVNMNAVDVKFCQAVAALFLA